MKKRSERMRVVFEMAERSEKKAMDMLSSARQFLDQQQEQLSNLESYHQQYMDSMRNAMQGTMAVSDLQAYQGFIHQVDKAMDHQKNVIAQAQQQFDRCKQEWLSCREKRKGIEELIQRYRQEEQIALEKKEAKQLEDDLVSRRYRS